MPTTMQSFRAKNVVNPVQHLIKPISVFADKVPSVCRTGSKFSTTELTLVALTAQHVGNSGHTDGPILSLASPTTVDRIFSNTAWRFAEALVTLTSSLT